MDKLKGEDILYVGRKYALEGDKAFSLEYQTIKSLGIPFFPITTGRLQRKFTRYTISSLFKFPLGFSQSLYILKRFKPDVVLGFGGYVSWPVMVMASFLKIPVIIHEQTLEAGLTNKLAARFATKICISFESSKRFFPIKKVVFTGNPLRKEILEVNEQPKVENVIPLIYITGGSLGSHFINDLVKDSVKKLINDFQIIHQTGDSNKYKDFDELQKIKNELGENEARYTVKKFLTPLESAKIMQKADLVVARAGINTVSELIFLEKPSLLIPLPFTQNNEQFKNARFLKAQGLGEILEQKKITTDVFLNTLEKMKKNIISYKINNGRLKALADKDAALRIVEVVKDVYKKKKNKN
jgi:UDP-N-acetylglucosamine--N-acetylmuramyl-(pentapeptide) pyrophosphoryl-undecaprenol N-acetylglucosamine transferase